MNILIISHTPNAIISQNAKIINRSFMSFQTMNTLFNIKIPKLNTPIRRRANNYPFRIQRNLRYLRQMSFQLSNNTSIMNIPHKNALIIRPRNQSNIIRLHNKSINIILMPRKCPNFTSNMAWLAHFPNLNRLIRRSRYNTPLVFKRTIFPRQSYSKRLAKA